MNILPEEPEELIPAYYSPSPPPGLPDNDVDSPLTSDNERLRMYSNFNIIPDAHSLSHNKGSRYDYSSLLYADY
jgi:hypothetical protein